MSGGVDSNKLTLPSIPEALIIENAHEIVNSIAVIRPSMPKSSYDNDN